MSAGVRASQPRLVPSRRHRRAGLAGWAALAFAPLLACTTLPISEPHAEGVYGKALEKATRRATLYSGLETRAFVRATYLSLEFIAAQARYLSELRAEPPEVADQRLKKMLAENKVPSFFVALHTPDRNWNDWQEGNSVWRVAADTGQGQIDHPKVLRFEKPDAEMLALYPYFDTYSIGYFLHFEGAPTKTEIVAPIAAHAIISALGHVQLLAAGALGQLKLDWDLTGGSSGP